MPSTAVELRADARTAENAADEPASGPDGWRQQVTVTTQLEHDTGPSTYEIWLSFAWTSGRAGLAGLADSPDPGATSRPLWLTQQIRVVTGPGATVIAGSRRTNLSGWLQRAESAEAAVRKRIGESASSRWSTGLVIELPSDQEAFDQALGVKAGSYDQIAAVAWPQGPDPSTAAVRVVVNPGPAASLDDERLAVLITHEATHVLTRSADSPAPMWLVEGLADWVAFDRIPSVAAPTRDLVLDKVRSDGAPKTLPSDADFRPDAADLNLTYGRAWLLCSFIAEESSADDLVRLYAEIDGGTPVAAAMEDVFGMDEQTLLQRWQSWLVRDARR